MKCQFCGLSGPSYIRHTLPSHVSPFEARERDRVLFRQLFSRFERSYDGYVITQHSECAGELALLCERFNIAVGR